MFQLLKKLRLAKASKAFTQARERYLDALSRGDTRDQHDAHKRLVEAQNARLRVELGHR